VFGIAKAVVGYLAASASTQFELESLFARTVLTGVFVLVHNLCLAGLERALLETPPPFQSLALASGVLINTALGLIFFQVLDRFRLPA
jgi:cell shape-determining protein MreD